jgi:F-box and WD-40 domain protein CDC4
MASSVIAISGSRDATLRVWNIETGECLNVLKGHRKSVRTIAVCGNLAVSASYDHDARLWNINDGTCLSILKRHKSKIYSVVFDGKVIATGSMDLDIRVWDPNSGYVHYHSIAFGLENARSHATCITYNILSM